MKRIFFAIFAALLGFTGVSAQVEFKDIEFTADSPASVELGMGINYITFTAPEDGAVEFHVGWTSTMVYITDEAGTEDTKVLLAKDADENGYIYRMTVEAGRKYYVSTSIVTDPLTMTVGYASEVDAIKLSANYDDGDVFNKPVERSLTAKKVKNISPIWSSTAPCRFWCSTLTFTAVT